MARCLKIAQSLLGVLLIALALFPCRDVVARGKSYRKVLNHWTRHDSAYNRRDNFADMVVTATYFAPDYLEARADEYARHYGLGTDERQHYVDSRLSPLREGPHFFVSLYTRELKWNTLETDADTALWRVELVQGERHCAPSKIETSRHLTPEDAYFFPYVARWDRTYLIAFSPDCTLSGQEPFSLSIRGLYGASRLTWK